ncbi:hypothetical protein [Alsobacter soli]|uniref:hypothetical protein n=1 Tax=Alsobacter soli TaxID=2109933 RepID=UPI0018AD3BC1|nr:hypothetical protein [Alsobacter soli]
MPPKALPRDPRPLRVRHEPPTLEEAVFAAQGLTDDVDQQTDIVAGLMELPPDEVRPQVAKLVAEAAKQAKPTLGLNRMTATVETRTGAPRTVVVEKTRRFKVSVPPRTVIDLTRRGATN